MKTINALLLILVLLATHQFIYAQVSSDEETEANLEPLTSEEALLLQNLIDESVSSLFNAIQEGNYKTVETNLIILRSLKDNLDLDRVFLEEDTPLFTAVYHGHPAIVRLLMAYGCNPNNTIYTAGFTLLDIITQVPAYLKNERWNDYVRVSEILKKAGVCSKYLPAPCPSISTPPYDLDLSENNSASADISHITPGIEALLESNTPPPTTPPYTIHAPTPRRLSPCFLYPMPSSPSPSPRPASSTAASLSIPPPASTVVFTSQLPQ